MLIPKESTTVGGITKAQPICLIDEIGKSFERIILERITRWMQDKEGILFINQFSFRKGRSTMDALIKVTDMIEEAISNGGCRSKH